MGWVLTDIGGLLGQAASPDGAAGVALQSDGKIVAAGFTRLGSFYSDFAIVRYTADGTVDTTFGGGLGVAVVDFAGGNDWANGVAIQADGKIVAAGVTTSQNIRAFGLVRLDAGGAPDATFGPGAAGRVTTKFQDWDKANAVAIQPQDGRIVVAGMTDINVNGLPVTYFDFALARYDSTGALDGTFGVGGRATADIGGGFDVAYAVALQADGRIVAAGSHADTANVELYVDMAVVRFTTDGVPDATFGAGGAVTTHFDGIDVAQGVAIQADCKIVAAGYTWVLDAGGLEYTTRTSRLPGMTAAPVERRPRRRAVRCRRATGRPTRRAGPCRR